MSMAASARLAAAMLVVALLGVASGITLLALSWSAQTPPIWAFRGFPYFIGLTFAIVGYRIARCVPGNPIGWLGLFSAAAAGIQGASIDYATLALYAGRELPGGELGAWYLVAASALTVPAAFGVAILRYRLYEIDALINRAVVYGLLTAILAGLYTASIGFFQRFFVAATGERSDAAIVLTTLIIASAFTPLKSSLQSQVDRRLKSVPDDQRRLAAFRERVRTVAEALEPSVLRRRFLEESVAALGAVGGRLETAERHEEERAGEWSATRGSGARRPRS